MADPKTKEEDQNAIPPETDWPSPNIRPLRQWPVGFKQFISNFGIVIVVLIGLITAIGCIYLLYDIIRTYFDTNNENQFANLRNSLFILAALIGTPFFVWRTMLAAEQTKTAEKQATIAQEKSYTELFTQAIEQLGSEKPSFEETNDIKGDPFTRETRVPNIEVRVGALYALERIMHDSDKDAKTIIDTLCTYVKHNCGEPKIFENEIPEDQLEKLDEDEIKIKRDEFIETLKEDPPANRYDIQTALKIIGRRPVKYKTYESMPDLTKVNLQGADLVNFNLSLCDLANAHLEGADLKLANMQEAKLQGAKLQGADLYEAKLQGADLYEAKLQGADLYEAKLQGADLYEAKLQGADLYEAKLQDVQITDAHKTAASVIWVDFTKAKYDFDILQEQVMDMFGHKTQTFLPDGMKVPDHWSEVDMDNNEGHEQYMREWWAFKKEKGVD